MTRRSRREAGQTDGRQASDVREIAPASGSEEAEFVGRSTELTRLDRLHRAGAALVSIVGPAGVGKTRLAHRHLSRSTDPWDERWFVDASTVVDCDELVETVADVLTIPLQQQDGARERISEALSERGRILMVLDNLEQLGPEATVTIDAWIADCPNLSIVATSRAPLEAATEEVVELGGLSPEDGLDLLAVRATEVRKGRALNEEERSVAADIVARLDQLPLAIEFAAARFDVLSATEVLGRLDKPLSILARPDADEDDRHASMRAALSWSWQLLDPTEQRVLSRLSVFVGGLDLPAAEAVCSDDDQPILDAIHMLLRKGLLVRDGSSSARSRYSMSSSTRQFAWEHLPDQAETCRLHADQILQRAEGWTGELYSTGGENALEELSRERENLWAICRRYAEADPELHMRAALALDPLLTIRGPQLSRRALLERAQSLEQECAPALRAKLHIRLADFRLRVGELEQADRVAAEGEAFADDAGRPDLRAHATCLRAWIARMSGAADDAEVLGKAARDQAAGSCARYVECQSLALLACLDYDRAEFVTARSSFGRVLALRRELGDPVGTPATLNSLGVIHKELGDLDRAWEFLSEALAGHRALGDRARLPHVMANMAGVALGLHRLTEARKLATEALQLGKRAADAYAIYLSLSTLADVHLAEGQPEIALEYLQAATLKAERLGDPGLVLGQRNYVVVAEAMRHNLEGAEAALVRAHAIDDAPLPQNVARDIVTGFVEVERARRLRPTEPERAAELLGSARDRLNLGAEFSDASSAVGEARVILRKWLAKSTATLLLGPELTYVQFDVENPVDLEQRPVLRRMVRALIDHRDAPLTTDQLFSLVWPQEPNVKAASKRNRVWVLIAKLRKLGFEPYLERSKAGYRLSGDLQISEA